MNHPLIKASALAVVLLQALPSQDQATTLATLAQRADLVVRATVTQSVHPTPQWHQLTLRADAVLKGAVGATFTLTEPAGRCCGRSLFALQVGDERVLFLKRVGPVLHTLGGGRGVLPTTPALLAHTEQLLQASTSNALGHLLAQNLEHAEPRIAHDAALSLAVLPNLSLTPAERSAVATSLLLSVQRGSTKTAALADVAARLGDASMVDAVLPVYMNATRNDQADLLRKALVRCSPALVAERMPVFVGATRRGNLRAATLLVDLPPHLAHAAMTDLLTRPNHPQVQLHLCEGLLAAGVSQAALQPMVPEVVLEMAIERRNRRPVFKNIRPRR